MKPDSGRNNFRYFEVSISRVCVWTGRSAVCLPLSLRCIQALTGFPNLPLHIFQEKLYIHLVPYNRLDSLSPFLNLPEEDLISSTASRNRKPATLILPWR